ncbi:hypothetical protein [Agrococcus beijingensis]|uniref:hypothetical protein n=1 Tax=Agrococcus beijingensis TaxID=3068634 RepID=UPI002741E675|nr:hypothetical protein [Agrococcus sp. REN33]
MHQESTHRHHSQEDDVVAAGAHDPGEERHVEEPDPRFGENPKANPAEGYAEDQPDA